MVISGLEQTDMYGHRSQCVNQVAKVGTWGESLLDAPLKGTVNDIHEPITSYPRVRSKVPNYRL